MYAIRRATRADISFILEAHTLPHVRTYINAPSREQVEGSFANPRERFAHRAFVEVSAQNQRARRLYERHGFRLEGIWRDGMRSADTEAFEDLCAYGILECEYRQTTRSRA